MIEKIQETTGKILQVRIVSTYDFDTAEILINEFIRNHHDIISIEPIHTKNGRILIQYYNELESEIK